MSEPEEEMAFNMCNLFDIFRERGFSRPSVRPYMDQPKTVSSIDLIVLFVIEKGGDIFQGFCNCASSSGSLDTLLSVATSATMPVTIGTATAIIWSTSFGCFYFSEAFACQNVADIDRSRCKTRSLMFRDL